MLLKTKEIKFKKVLAFGNFHAILSQMLLSEATAQERLESPRNLANRFGTPSNVSITVVPRAIHKPAVPSFLKTTAAIISRSGAASTTEVAEQFGFSAREARYIDSGKRPTGVDEVKVETALAPIRDIALEKLTNSLLGITKDKTDKLGAKDLSTVAANMSKVVEKLTPAKAHEGNNVQINIFTPETRKEAAYQTVEV